jgi:2-dehydropantoate 2-reductase
MRIVVLGCGGIGGTLAACLVRAGADVTPVTGNPEISRVLIERGFRVQDFGGGEWTVRSPREPLVRLHEMPAEAGQRFDLCIAATQSTTLEEALASVLPHLADDGVVLCCQNGLPEERAAAVVGAGRVLGGVVGWGASMIEPGRYQRTSSSQGVLALGRPGPQAPDPERVAAALTPATPIEVIPALATVRWSKLAINCVTSALGAVGGERLGSLLSHRFVRRLALEVFAEVAEVARALGVRPAPLAGTLDIEKVAITPAERLQRLGSLSLAYKHSILLAVGLKYRRMRSSMLYAIERGRPPEIDHLNGEVVRRGAALGIATPINTALVDVIHRLVRERTAAGGVRSGLALLRALYEETIGGGATALSRAA